MLLTPHMETSFSFLSQLMLGKSFVPGAKTLCRLHFVPSRVRSVSHADCICCTTSVWTTGFLLEANLLIVSAYHNIRELYWNFLTECLSEEH